MARPVRIASPVVLPKQTDKIQPKSEPNLDDFIFSTTLIWNLNPASVEFAEDLPAAGRCKAARAQTYDDTSSPCQRRPASRRDKIGAPGG